jgi:hypothetical protein
VTDQLPHLRDVPSLTLCRQIIDGLKGAPLEHLRAYIAVRIRKTDRLGILRDYAQAVGRAWVREHGARQRAAEAREAHDASDREQARRVAQETLDDPRAGPEDKALANDLLGNRRSKKTGGGG